MDAFAVAPVAHPLRTVTRGFLLIVAFGAALYLTSRYDYLLFHGVTEVFSIAVACTVFMFSWSSRDYLAARPFVFLGIGYLFVAVLDLLHALTYSGMAVLPSGHDYATKLWVAARGLQALVTLAFVLLSRFRRVAPHWLAFAGIAAATAALIMAIFWWNIFPLCFVEGQGVTPLKKASEYAIAAMLAASILLLYGRSTLIGRQERNLLAAAFALNIAAELVFTLYQSAYGYENLIGHYLKIGSFYLAYQALFASEVRRRIKQIQELEASKARLEKSESELRKANVSKDRFFSILAHDLRNPITGILSLSEVLANRFEQLSPGRARELCGLVHDGARGGAELLEAILQWARAQTGRLEVRPAPVKLPELCEGIVALHAGAAESKGVSLRSCVEQGAVAFADENMLATILRNLLSNAVKFTPRGGEVLITSETQGEWVKLSVKDTGIGIGPEDLGKLFQIDKHFSSLGTNQERGNGMGLILCKELVDLNGGLISVESGLGRGSTFTVRLPISQPISRPAVDSAREAFV
jgi:signal transduction histidine kinase